MADLTIHELQNEATSPAANDYMVLDGATAGTRKITPANLATWILGKISSLATTVTSFASGDFIAVSNTTIGASKMSKDTLLELTAQNALVGNVAPAFDATRTSENPYKAGESVVYEGKTYLFKVDHYGAWAAADVFDSDVAVYVDSVNNKVTEFKSFKDDFISGYIVTSGAIGSVVNYDVVANNDYKHVVINCFGFEKFVVKGTGASNPRLWCFVDSEDKVLANAPASTTYSDDTVIVAPQSAVKLIVNTSSVSYPSGVFKCEYLANVRISFNEMISERNIGQTSFKTEFENGYIVTNGSAGSVVDLSVVADVGWRYSVQDCSYGDKFVVKGTGGSIPRLWCFIDSDNKIIYNSEGDLSPVDALILETPKGAVKLIINTSSASYNDDSYSVFTRSIYCQEIVDEEKVNTICREKNRAYEDFKTDFTSGYIATSGAVGSVVDLSVVADTGWRHSVQDCSYGDKIIVKGYGGSTPRLWCFIDKDNFLISQSAASYDPSEPLTLEVPERAAKLIVNASSASYANDTSVFKKSCYLQEAFDIIKANSEEIEKIKGFKPNYNYNLEPQDFAADIADVDFSWAARTLRLEQVYAKFETLIEDFPALVTKYDAAVEASESYPAYANGVGDDDPDYLETPAYKMYMYKVSNSNVGAGNTGKFKKKKLLIIAGQHGSETAAPFNAYLFAKKLCDATEQAAFSILSYFDVYIIPCVNGYGLYHYTRENANGVNLNRNYPTPNWHVAGEGTYDYTGPTAGSEFETKVVMAIAADLKPDMFVDHHNYDYMEAQFYTDCPVDGMLGSVYNSLVNLSSHFIRLFPTYFGSFFRLLQKESAGYSPRNADKPIGTASYWAYDEYDIPSATIEICQRINYVNGEYSSSAGNYTNDAWKVGYMTLSEQVMRYSELCYK